MRSFQYSCCRFNALCIWNCRRSCCYFSASVFVVVVAITPLLFLRLLLYSVVVFCSLYDTDFWYASWVYNLHVYMYIRSRALYVCVCSSSSSTYVLYAWTKERKKTPPAPTNHSVELFHINWPNALKFRLVCSRLSLIADLFHWSFFFFLKEKSKIKIEKVFSLNQKITITWLCRFVQFFNLCLWIKKNKKKRTHQNF